MSTTHLGVHTQRSECLAPLYPDLLGRQSTACTAMACCDPAGQSLGCGLWGGTVDAGHSA